MFELDGSWILGVFEWTIFEQIGYRDLMAQVRGIAVPICSRENIHVQIYKMYNSIVNYERFLLKTRKQLYQERPTSCRCFKSDWTSVFLLSTIFGVLRATHIMSSFFWTGKISCWTFQSASMRNSSFGSGVTAVGSVVTSVEFVVSSVEFVHISVVVSSVEFVHVGSVVDGSVVGSVDPPSSDVTTIGTTMIVVMTPATSTPKRILPHSGRSVHFQREFSTAF